MDIEELMERRQRVLQHLMTSLETWRGSPRIQPEPDRMGGFSLTDEEKELRHAYDLLQVLIAEIQTVAPGTPPVTV